MIRVRIDKTHVKNMVSVPQLKANVASPLGISKTSYYRAVDNLNSNKRYQAPPELFAKLKDIGSIANKSPKCEVISLKTASKLLKSLQVQPGVIASLLQKTEATLVPPSPSSSPQLSGENDLELQLKSDPAPEGQQDDQPIADSQAHSSLLGEQFEYQTEQEQQDIAGPEFYHPSSIEIEDSEWGPSNAGYQETMARYGLNTIKNKSERAACMGLIQLDVESFQKWSQQVYQPGRDPKRFKQQGKSTFESTKQRVHEYLGYLYHYKSVARPTLQMYSDSGLFQSFMGFMATRGIDKAGTLKVGF